MHASPGSMTPATRHAPHHCCRRYDDGGASSLTSSSLPAGEGCRLSRIHPNVLATASAMCSLVIAPMILSARGGQAIDNNRQHRFTATQPCDHIKHRRFRPHDRIVALCQCAHSHLAGRRADCLTQTRVHPQHTDDQPATRDHNMAQSARSAASCRNSSKLTFSSTSTHPGP